MTQRLARHVPRSPSMTPVRPRSMLFTLYGDYAYPRRTDVPLRGLVEVGQALGLSEVAVRSAVARLAREGWIVACRDVVGARYGLSDTGRHLIEEGTRRIYKPRSGRWDGTWCVLNYSIPESQRSGRDRIRKQLAWLGLGPMGGGAYVSPRDVRDELLEMLRRHRLHAYARVFASRLAGPCTDAELVAQCWDLRSIARSYEAFVAFYEPQFRRDRALRARRALADVDAFVTRFALTHDFRRFPFMDPDLPAELLPRGWSGAKARRLFEAHHAMLTGGAVRFFEKIAGRDA